MRRKHMNFIDGLLGYLPACLYRYGMPGWHFCYYFEIARGMSQDNKSLTFKDVLPVLLGRA
jgi:hypothetical protein